MRGRERGMKFWTWKNSRRWEWAYARMFWFREISKDLRTWTIKRMTETETEWDGEKDVEFAWTSRLETVSGRGSGGETWEEENGPIKHFETLSNFRSGTNSWSTKKKKGARNGRTEVKFAFSEVRWVPRTDDIKIKGPSVRGMCFDIFPNPNLTLARGYVDPCVPRNYPRGLRRVYKIIYNALFEPIRLFIYFNSYLSISLRFISQAKK